jgi:nitrite reductase/ring-hydroxylating ferredoxin subunit
MAASIGSDPVGKMIGREDRAPSVGENMPRLLAPRRWHLHRMKRTPPPEASAAEPWPRRRVLAAACALCTARCAPPPYSTPCGPISAGKASDLAVGALRDLGEVAIGRDANGLYAMSTICTHAGCPTQPTSGGLYCACHGSLFASDGRVIRGPARAPLPHYQLDVDPAGDLTVQAGMVVPASDRTTLP